MDDRLARFARTEYGHVVASVARITGDRANAADAVQDALLAFLENPPRHPVDNLAAWITVAATNRSRDRYRRALAESRAVDRMPPPHLTAQPDHDVHAALRGLPDRQREVCVLHYLLDESVDAIAGRLAVSSGSVKTHLFRGRRALAARLAG